MKKIIRCPVCEKNGIKQSLAEVLDSGMVSILRRGYGKYAEYTVVSGSEFTLKCGNCGNTVFVRQSKHEVLHKRS